MLYVISSVMMKTNNCLKVYNFHPNRRGKQNKKKSIQNMAKKRIRNREQVGQIQRTYMTVLKQNTKNYIKYIKSTILQ